MIEELSRRALGDIQKLITFPDKGTIAGGSLANLIWEYVSGNKAVLNDVDVFLYKGEHEYVSNSRNPNYKKAAYDRKDIKYKVSYGGLGVSVKQGEYYYILDTSYDERGEIPLNTIEYAGNNSSPMIIIDSFDLNCTQIAYSIEEDKFYYTDAFIEFIETGELKVVDLGSPSHTIIRLFKKEEELKAKLNRLEPRLCQIAINRHFVDVNKNVFTDKYIEIAKKYPKVFKFVFPNKDNGMSTMMRNWKGINEQMWRFSAKDLSYAQDKPNYWSDEEWEIYKFSLKSFTQLNFIYFVRNVYPNKDRSYVWSQLSPIYDHRPDYVDMVTYTDDAKEKIKFLRRVIEANPDSIPHLKGYTLSEQLFVVDKVFEHYDKATAIKILGRCRIQLDFEWNEDDILILGLSVRKLINNKMEWQINRIFNETDTTTTTTSDDESGNEAPWEVPF